MQNPEYRQKYIDKIPDTVELPYPIKQLDKNIDGSERVLQQVKKDRHSICD